MPGRREDRRGVLGQLPAHAPRVAAHDDAALGRPGHAREELLRQPPGRAGDDGAVHPVGPRAEDAAQPRRAELERAGEAVGQIGRRRRSG